MLMEVYFGVRYQTKQFMLAMLGPKEEYHFVV
jgi:hypothetical protein